ncbi:MAG: hypothetical protein WCO86_13830 [Planctomycetota bacterium]
MSESASRPRFIPPLCVYGGFALCVVITALLYSWSTDVDGLLDGLIQPTHRYYLLVVVAISLISAAVDIGVASAFSLWVTVSFILAINFLSRTRRLLFKKELIEWGKWYALITFLAILALSSPD